MKEGDKVTIYEDPLTEERVEDEARIVKIIDPEYDAWDGRVLIMADVRFVGESEEHRRLILTQS